MFANRAQLTFGLSVLTLLVLVSTQSRPKRRKSIMSLIRPGSVSKQSITTEPILHLKFFAGRPPEFAASHRYAHEIAADPASVELPEGLKTDVQRDGIARYLVNNFKQVHLETLL